MNVGELQAYLRLNSTQFNAGLMAAQGKLGKFGGVAGQVFKTTAKVAAVALGAMTAALVKGIADAAKFEKQLAQVSTMLDKSTMKYMKDYRTGLSAMSQMFGEATETLSRGLYDILSASIPAAKALDVLAVAATAAKAGLTETGTTADALTTILNAYKLEAEEAGYVSDILFTTVKYGKCVTGDTRILLADGRYERIDSLNGENEIVSWDYRNFTPAQAHFVDMGKKKTIEIETRSGRNIKTTPEHPYLTPNGWKRVDQLKIGDKIAVPTSLPFFGNIKPKDGFPELLGLLLAEGSISNGSPRLAIGNHHTYKIAKTAAAKYGVKFKKINQKAAKCDSYMLTAGERGGHKKNPLIEELKRINIWGTNCYTKTVPQEVYGWDKNSISLFLNAYFTGDGWLCQTNRQWSLGFSSISKELLTGIAHLLLRFGVNGSIYQSTKNSQKWEAHRFIEIKRFMDFIGISRDSVADFNNYKPADVLSRTKALSSFGKPKREPTEYRRYKGIRDTSSQIKYESIKSLTEGPIERVYDLTVPVLRNFVANDIVAHNTTFAELAPVVGQVATVGAKAGASIEELGAMMSIMTRNGLNSFQATTALRSMLVQLIKPSDEAIKTAEELGIQWGISAVKAHGLQGVLEDIAELPADVIAKLFPNVRAITGVLAAQGELTEELEKFQGVLNDGSATIDAYNKNTDTLAHNWDQLKQTIVATSRRIGDTAMPEFRKFVNTITAWLQGPGGQAIEDFFKNIVGQMIEFVPKFVNVVNNIRKGFQFLIDIVGPVYQAWFGMFKAIVDGLVEVVTEMFSFSGDTESAFNTVQNILKGGLVAYMTYYKGVTFAIKVIIDWIKTYVEAVKAVGGTIAAVFRGDWEAAKESAKNIGTAFKDLGSDIKEDWQDTLGTVPETVDKMFGTANLTLEELRSKTGSFFKDAQGLSQETLELFEHDEHEKTTINEEGNDDRSEDNEETTEEDKERIAAFNEWYQGVIEDERDAQIRAGQVIAAAKAKHAEEEKARIEEEKRLQKQKTDYIKQLTMTMYQQIGNMVDKFYSNQIAWIDYNLAVEKNRLHEQLGDTEEYEEAVKELEKQAAKDKYQIELKQFKVRKAESAINTVISTAAAIMKAFEQLGPIGGAIASAFIGGLGIAKEALILSQAPPPPPTFYRGGEVEAGILQGKPGIDQNYIAATAGEYIMPPAQTAENINELEAMRQGVSSQITVQPGTVIVSLDGREIARATVPYLENEYDSGRARVNPRAVRAS